MSLSRKTLFTSSLNRSGVITYVKTNGIGRIEITSQLPNNEVKKYEFVCVFLGDMHFYKGNFDSVIGRELLIKRISASTFMVYGEGRFLPEKRYSISVSYEVGGKETDVNLGFYRRYRHRDTENSNVVCNFSHLVNGVDKLTPIFIGEI